MRIWAIIVVCVCHFFSTFLSAYFLALFGTFTISKPYSIEKKNEDLGDYCCLCVSQGWLATRSPKIYGHKAINKYKETKNKNKYSKKIATLIKSFPKMFF